MGHLRVLVCHNRYQQRGGEDSVFESEVALLRSYGNTVQVFERDNAGLDQSGRFSAAINTIWSNRSIGDFENMIHEFKPDVVHVHNTFARISPSIYWAANRLKVPVVQTLHNFRLICPQAMLLRNGKVCEDCIGKIPWRGVVRACFRESKAQTAVLAGMITVHRIAGTWQNKVTRYIALNEFCRQKFIEGGLPAGRIVVKPNFVDFDAPANVLRSGFLFVGRLSSEKGVDVLVAAASQIENAEVHIAGVGPESEHIQGVANVKPLGALGGDAVRVMMSRSMALILPSIWYENFPRTLVEAFGCGLPVIASRIGALAELVQDGVTGLLFDPGNADDLADKMCWALDNPDRMSEMGRNARNLYEAEFTAHRNYQQLIAIYRDAIEEVKTEFSHNKS